MMKTKKSSKGLALVLAAVLALTPMAGFPLTALATGETAAPQVEAPATDAEANTDTAPGATPSTPAADAKTPQAEAPATDAAQPAAPVPTTSAAIALTAPAAAVESAAVSEGDVVINEINFPDPVFRSYIAGLLGKTEGASISSAELLAVTKINVCNKQIKDMKGIEYFTALTDLACDGNQLTTLDVSANTVLAELSCALNELTALNLPATDTLTSLTCLANSLTNLDVSANPGLKWIECAENKLTTLDASANLDLISLNCQINPLTTLDLPVSDILTNLGCHRGKLTTLDVSTVPNLAYLSCHDNQLTTLDVSSVPNLTSLPCHDNQLTTLDLTGLNKLSEDSWSRSFSPQAPQIPVVKRGAQYELDIKALAKGQTLTAITLDGAPVPDLEMYEKMRDTNPKDLQYTCATSAVGKSGQTMEVKATCVLYHPATLVTDGNGTLTCDVASPMANELVLLDGSNPAFTITPASGYQVATLTVNGEDAKGSLAGETLTLPAVTDAVTIAVTFEEIPAPPKPPTPAVNYYSVTATAENGTITPEHPTTVREGNSLKCTFSPKEGYALESVSVNGKAVEATDDSTATTTTTAATTKTYSYNINSIYSNTTIHVSFKAVEPPVDPPKPPVDPADPVDPPKPPVDPAGPINPPTPPVVPDNGGNNNGTTTIVERTNTVTVPAAPQAAALAAPETPATPAAAAAKTEATPAKAAAEPAAPQGQLENPTLGAQAFDMQHSHLPLALLLLAVWLVGGFAVIRQRKHTHDAIEGTSY